MLPWASILGPSTTLPPLPEFWPLYARRFRSVSRWLARALFASVRLHGAAGTRAADHGPVVVYSNHPSFWDPVILGLATERLWPERAILAAIEPGALEQPPQQGETPWNVRLRGLCSAAVLIGGQVRQWHRLAQLRSTSRRGDARIQGRPPALEPSHRGPLCALRGAPGPRV